MAPTPEQIDALGRQAAQLAKTEGISVGDAVLRVIEGEPSLTPHHIRTICWEANNEHFRLLARERERGGGDLVFRFSLADPDQVMAKLKEKAEGRLEVEGVEELASDYASPPQAQPQPGEMEASPPSPEDVAREAKAVALDAAQNREAAERVASAFKEAAWRAESRLADLEERFYKTARWALLEGASLEQLLDLVSASVGEKRAEAEFSWLLGRMRAEEPELFAKIASVERAPSGYPNVEHPLFGLARELEGAREELRQIKEAYVRARVEEEEARELEKLANVPAALLFGVGGWRAGKRAFGPLGGKLGGLAGMAIGGAMPSASTLLSRAGGSAAVVAHGADRYVNALLRTAPVRGLV